jgi:hypothetical protein
MPIDTSAKRKSCIGLAAPWARPGIIPDGSNLSAAQRLHTDYLYSGIAAGAPGGGTVLSVLDRAIHRQVFGRVWARMF